MSESTRCIPKTVQIGTTSIHREVKKGNHDIGSDHIQAKRNLPKMNWNFIRIREISDVVRGASPRPAGSPLFFDGDYMPWITVSEVTADSNMFLTSTKTRLTERGASYSRVLEAGTLILTNSGATLGVPKITKIRAAANDGIAALINLRGIDQKYLYYCLQSCTQHLREVVAPGNGQPNLNTELIGEIRIPFPPKPEQQKIALILETWDTAINVMENLFQNSIKQKQDLMQGLLARRRGFDSSKAHWSQVDFDKIFERITRKNSIGNQNVLTISGQYGLISQREFFKKSVASENLAGYTLLDRGDFAYNKSYSTGYPVGAIKPLLSYASGVVSSLYICFRAKPDAEVDADFYRHYFEAGMLNDEITGIAQEGARNHGLLNVSVKDFFKLKLLVPPIHEQLRIAEVINAAEAEAQCVRLQLEALKKEKKALLADLLAGKRRILVSSPTLKVQVVA
jgi:type I restriction enzyme S subunit